MKQLKVKLFSLIMTIMSFLYLIYVYFSEETAMNADAVGGDPGGKVLPYIMGFIVFAGSLYKTIKERPDSHEKDSEATFLFASTLCLSIAYIALNKIVGFVILTVILVYTNIYLYTTIGETRNARQAFAGGGITMFATVAVYSVSRLTSKKLLRLGRSGVLPLFRTSSSTAIVSLFIVTAFLLIIIFSLGKKVKGKCYKRIWDASIVTFAVTLYLYVIFKQFFAVALAPGFLAF